jgi:glycosyltransferase involved in cell wall biosynthesis
MKLAIIAPTSMPSRRANTLQVMKMCQAFVSLGHDIRLAIPEENQKVEVGNRDWDFLANHYGLSTQFQMKWLPANPGFRKYDYAWHAVRWARAWEAEIIYTRLPQAAAIAARQGLQTILEVHDFPQGNTGPLLFRIFLHGSGARRLIVISSPLAADLGEKFGSTIAPPFLQMQPDGVDLERYTGLPEPEENRRKLVADNGKFGHKLGDRFQTDRFTVGYTGHLYPGRGDTLLLELAKQLPQVNFLIVGGEPKDVARVQEVAKKNDLENTFFTGFIPNAELPTFQSACEVLLMPYQERVSASSGGNIAKYLSPMKLFEYLACGRAIIASDLPVFRDVLTAENAILLPPDETSSWVDAIQKLIENPFKRNGI